MPTDPDRGSTTRRSAESKKPPPFVQTTKRVTFTPSMLIEALNSAYPGLKIGPSAHLLANSDKAESIQFEWSE